MEKLTIFTPTYNRAHLLTRLYDSLCAQTDKSFVWLIVDDGSTDNTKELVDGFIKEAKILIRYYYQENGGKMRAHNRGVELTKTPFFLCVDSDDYLVKDGVRKILSIDCEPDKHRNIAGLIAHKGKSETELLSDTPFPIIKGFSSTLYDLYLKGFKGETTIMFRSDVIKKFPFPEIDGEKYVPEDYIYDKIDRIYEYVVLPEIITVCEIVSEGYTDSVSKLKHNNPQAFYLYYEQRARITPLSVLKIKYLGFYVRYAFLTKHNIFKTKIPFPFVLVGLVASLFIKE